MQQPMKSMNMMSTMGRSPTAAAPVARPTIAVSEIGRVEDALRTELVEKPLVVPNTLPYTATSSPARKTSGSARMHWAIASGIARTNGSGLASVATVAVVVMGASRRMGLEYTSSVSAVTSGSGLASANAIASAISSSDLSVHGGDRVGSDHAALQRGAARARRSDRAPSTCPPRPRSRYGIRMPVTPTWSIEPVGLALEQARPLASASACDALSRSRGGRRARPCRRRSRRACHSRWPDRRRRRLLGDAPGR